MNKRLFFNILHPFLKTKKWKIGKPGKVLNIRKWNRQHVTKEVTDYESTHYLLCYRKRKVDAVTKF